MMVSRFFSAPLSRSLMASVALFALAAPSMAAPVVMLQFGSFESEQEAQTRLTYMKNKHAGVLGDMPSLVREVKTPYGSTVFRTQVGPLAGRPQAQSICAQLVSSGDSECYIVESAMPQTPLAMPEKAVAKAAPTLEAPATTTTKSAPAVVAVPEKVALEKVVPAKAASVPTAVASAAPEAVKTLAPVAKATNATMMDGKRTVAKPAEKIVPAPTTTLAKVAPTLTPPAPEAAVPATISAPVTTDQASTPKPSGSINALYDKVASPEAREPITDTAKAIKQGSTQTVASTAMRDPQTANMLASVGREQAQPRTAPLVVTKPQGSGVAVTSAPDASMEAALANAAQNQPTQLRVKTPKTVEDATRESSWYDTINPFTEEEPVAAKRTANVKPIAVKHAAPEEESSFLSSLNPFSDSPAEKAKKGVTQTADSVPQAAAAAVPAMAIAAPATPTEANSYVAAPVTAQAAPVEQSALAIPATTPPSGMRLPPPPIPESDAERAALAQQIAQQPMNIQAPVATVPASAPISAAPLDAPVIPKGTSIADAARMMEAHNVRVEEARRVPLTDEVMQPAPTPPVVASAAPVMVAPADMPSQTSYNRTIWGHISYFDNAQQALAFWDGFRKANPDFPSVRVRVTSPYVAREQGNSLVSLRVGPFGSQGFVNELCDSDAVSDSDYSCRSVTDIGSAASTSQPRMVQPLGTSAGRYGRSGDGMAARDGIWVQLGAYASQQKAESDWQAMKLKHPSALRAMKAQLSTPPQGSHETPVYRLRTGPFLSQSAAEELCLRLKSDGAQCLVVSE